MPKLVALILAKVPFLLQNGNEIPFCHFLRRPGHYTAS